MSMTRILVTALSLAVASLGGAACSCQGQKNGLTKTDPVDPLAQRLTITVVGNSNVVLAPNRDVVLTFLVSYGNGDNVAGSGIGGVRVDFSKTGLADLFVGSDYGTTESDGTVTVRCRAGSTNGQGKVIAATEGATPVEVNIDVNGKYAGNLVVRAGYNGPVKIARLEVRLHDGRATCQQAWKATAPNGLPATVQTLTVPNVSTDARFNNLTEKTKYIATVVAVNAVNRPVAYGCGGPEEVQAQRDRILNIQLETLEPTVIGKYEFGQVMKPLDFLDQTSTVYLALDNVFRFLSSPTAFLLKGAQTSPGNYVGGCSMFTAGSPSHTACLSAGGVILDQLLKELLGLDSSGTAQKIYSAITQVAEQAMNIRVGGVLDIKTFDPTTGNVTAELRFDKYSLVWTWECPTGTVDAPGCCGHRVLDGSAMGIQPFGAVVKLANGTETSVFNGRLTKVTGTTEIAYDVSFDETYLSLRYGEVALAIIEAALLPALLTDTVRYPRDPQGRVKLGTLMTGLLNCGNATSNGNTAQLACQALAPAINAIIGQLAGVLSTTGSENWNLKQVIAGGRLTDSDEDLQTDAIDANFTFKATGSGSTVQQTNGKLRGQFTTTACTGDASCTAAPGLVCRFASDPVDTCMASNYCGVPTGVKQAYEACQIDDECMSGTCMTNPPLGATGSNVNKCFKACVADVDCGGQGHCDVDGYISQPKNQGLDPYANRDTYTGTCVP